MFCFFSIFVRHCFCAGNVSTHSQRQPSMKYLLLICIFIFTNCKSERKYPLTGSRLYFGGYTHNLRIERLDTTININSLKGEDINFYNPIWKKREDLIYVLKSERSKIDRIYKYDIFTMDLKGTIKDTIYSEKPDMVIGEIMPSPNDSLMLIQRFNYQDWKNSGRPGDTTWYEFNMDYIIFDMVGSKVYKTLSLKSDLFLRSFTETVWCNNSQRVVITRKPEQSINNRKPEEAYIFDILTGDTTFVDFGYNFIWSPTQENIISYAKENSIYFYNTKNASIEEFYKLPPKYSISSFRWSLNGDALILYCGEQPVLLKSFGKLSSSSTELIILIKDKSIIEKDGYEKITSWK